MKPFLIIKTGGTFPEFSRRHDDFEHWTAQAMGLGPDEYHCINVQSGQTLPSWDTFAGCAITGSHDMVTDTSHDWIEATATWIRQSVDSGLPMIGICFGHQLLARVLGGQAGFHHNGPEIGTKEIALADAAGDDPIFSQLPSRFLGHTTHYQCALSLPQEAILLATSEHEPHQAFRFGDHVWGVQFHPEFSAEAMRYYITQQAETIMEHGGDVRSLLASVGETPESSAVMQHFAQYCRRI